MNKHQNQWANSLSAVKKYKHVYRKRLIETAILVLFFEVSLIYFFCKSLQNSNSINWFLIIFLIFLGLWDFNLVIRWIKSFKWTVDTSCIGIVIKKSRYSKDSPTKRTAHRAFFVVANTNEGEIEGRCLFSEYKKINLGDKVLFFTLGTKEIFAVLIE